MNLSKLVQQVEDFQKKLKAEGEETLKITFKELFDQFPEVVHFQWTQYTPYFNDGEECVFGVHEISVLLKGKEDPMDSWDMKDSHPELIKVLKDLGKSFSTIKDVMKAVFGDHAKVVVNRDKIKVTEYSHD